MDPRYYSNLNYSLSQVADFDEPVGQHMAQKAVGIPQSWPHHYPMMIGNAKVRYHRLPVRKEPRIVWK